MLPAMKRLRLAAGGLMLLSGVTHSADFLFWPASLTNSPTAAVFGVVYFAIGLLVVLRPGALGLWLGAIVVGIGGLLGGIVALGSPGPLAIFHAVIGCVAAGACIVLLLWGRRIALLVTGLVLSGLVFGLHLVVISAFRDPFVAVYAEKCSVCHGESFEGNALGPPLLGGELRHGGSVDEIAESISQGSEQTGMPAWSETLDEGQIRSLAILIVERREGYDQQEFNLDVPLVIPADPVESERHAFLIETVASDLHPWPFSIAPLPDGRILLTEKTRGLSIISPDGQQSELIEGTPPTYHDGIVLPPQALVYGLGWMLDVALHPDYEENGWIYLHFGDRCETCDTSMNKVIRGRIADGRWIDEETIWSADPASYNETPDTGAGGRISFDDQGHVFLSIGIKGNSNYHGIQDPSLPYGKIHRVHDDGRVPADNPFVGVADAIPTTWTYGHRNPQGLEFDPVTGRLWSTEMGPRGGDELNLLVAGRNYGWPLTSKGVDYDGTPVEYGKELGIPLDLSTIEKPVLDMTPAPAISSFALYRGDAFPEWQNNAIAGSLKAAELYRWELEGDRVVHTETLLKGLARIRDVEVGPDGVIYLLLEHASGSQIVRLVPE
jgi:glucose/arabinose dehydrogenase